MKVSKAMVFLIILLCNSFLFCQNIAWKDHLKEHLCRTGLNEQDIQEIMHSVDNLSLPPISSNAFRINVQKLFNKKECQLISDLAVTSGATNAAADLAMEPTPFELKEMAASNTLNALGQFIAGRFKKEVVLSFVEKFKDEMINAPLLKKIFPSTYECLRNTDSPEYFNFFPSLKASIKDDLSQLEDNLIAYLLELETLKQGHHIPMALSIFKRSKELIGERSNYIRIIQAICKENPFAVSDKEFALLGDLLDILLVEGTVWADVYSQSQIDDAEIDAILASFILINLKEDISEHSLLKYLAFLRKSLILIRSLKEKIDPKNNLINRTDVLITILEIYEGGIQKGDSGKFKLIKEIVRCIDQKDKGLLVVKVMSLLGDVLEGFSINKSNARLLGIKLENIPNREALAKVFRTEDDLESKYLECTKELKPDEYIEAAKLNDLIENVIRNEIKMNYEFSGGKWQIKNGADPKIIQIDTVDGEITALKTFDKLWRALKEKESNLRKLIDSFRKNASVEYLSIIKKKHFAGIAENARIRNKGFQQLRKYAYLFVGLMNAQTTQQAYQLMESVALPVGSYRLKRKSNFSLAINSYAGVFFNREIERTVSSGQGAIVNSGMGELNLAIACPVGIAMGLSKNWVVFLSVIDIGALFRYHFADKGTGSNDGFPEVNWQNVLAPGLFYCWNAWKNSPITFAVGIQYGPELRRVNEDASVVINPSRLRSGISMVIDIPLLQLYSK